MNRHWKACTLSFVCGLASSLPSALAQHQAAPKTNERVVQFVEDVGQPQFGGVLEPIGSKNTGAPGLRGTTVLYDTIASCTGYSRITQGPAAILDDGSFTPGPASVSGGTVTEIDFFVRPLVPLAQIRARVTFFNTITLAGAGNPLIVQSNQIISETYLIQGTAANTTPGLYQFTANITDFVIPDDDWGVEIAFVDANGAILPNNQVTTSFPGAACAPTMPAVGGNLAIFWMDNDLTNAVGDGIRYEPYDAAQAGVNQGDAVAFAAGTVFNGLALRFRGFATNPNSGACCLPNQSCILANEADCTAQSGTLTLGQACTQFFCVPPPANDDCLNAQVVTGFGTFPYDNRGATVTDAAPPCTAPQNVGEDVWFRWNAPCTGSVTLRTCLLNTTDDAFAVYQGSNCGDLNTIVACDDDGCGQVGGQATATFNVTQGTSYLFRIGTWNSTAGGNNFFELLNNSCTGGPQFCDADWCHDGSVGVPDIFCFLSDWFAFVPAARNYGGSPGVPAIFAFLSIWFATGQGPCTP